MALRFAPSTVVRRAHPLGLVAPLLLALSCSAPPGVGDDDEESDGPEAYGGPGAGAATGAGLQASPGGTAGTSFGSANGAGGSAGSEGPGANPALNPSQVGSAGQTANPAQPVGAAGAAGATSNNGAAGANGAMTPGSAGSSAMPPVVVTPPVVTPPPPVVTPPPAANAGCAGQFLCDDFEGVAAGASPSASIWTLFDNYNQTSASANVQVSGGNAHSGGKALRVAAASGRSGIVASLSQASYFVRVWLQVDTAPRGPVLIGVGTDQNAETRLRIFNQSWATINAVPGDAVRPEGATSGNCPTCVTIVPNQWFCAEMSVDNAARTATLWINDVEAATLTNAPNQPAVPKMFVGSMGLEGGQTGVWIDDVVAGPARIFCD